MKQAFKLTILLLIISGFTQLSAQTSGTLIPKKGLFVTTDAINWIAGSEVNFFPPDKKLNYLRTCQLYSVRLSLPLYDII